ncbi:unnamed protein product [marine sediment metagenome]|uniref:Helix-turn-helix domain-containing protein n=1 Tax=marine sediment metagenome TaxID=412755 RepID=X1SDR1_9ZZZZ
MELLTKSQTAKMLHISRMMLYRLEQRGDFQVKYFAPNPPHGKVLYYRDSIESWMDKRSFGGHVTPSLKSSAEPVASGGKGNDGSGRSASIKRGVKG